jgi:hypothetical protein
MQGKHHQCNSYRNGSGNADPGQRKKRRLSHSSINGHNRIRKVERIKMRRGMAVGERLSRGQVPFLMEGQG